MNQETFNFLEMFQPEQKTQNVDTLKIQKMLEKQNEIVEIDTLKYIKTLKSCQQFVQSESIKISSEQYTFIRDKLDMEQQTVILTIDKNYKLQLQMQLFEKALSPFLIRTPDSIKNDVRHPVSLQSKLFLNWFYYKCFLQTPEKLKLYKFEEIQNILLYTVNAVDLTKLCKEHQDLLKYYPVVNKLTNVVDKEYMKQVLNQKSLEMNFMCIQIIDDKFESKEILEKIQTQIVGPVLDELQSYPSLIFDIYIDILYFVLTCMSMESYTFNNFGDMSTGVLQSIISDRYDPMKFSMFRELKNKKQEDKMQEQVNTYNKLLQNIHMWRHIRSYKSVK